MDGAATRTSPRTRRLELVLLSLVLAASLGWVLHAGALPIFPPKGVLGTLVPGPFLAFFALLLVCMLAKYGRYHFLLLPFAKLPLRRLMSISAIAMALITFLPFRLGELSRPAMLREKGKVSGWALTGTVGAERIIDGVAFALLLVVGLVFAHPHEPVPDHIGALPIPATIVPRAAIVAALGFGGAFVVMVAFFRFRSVARRITERVVGVVSERLAVRLADIVERTSDGLRFLPNLKFLGPYVVLTAVSILSHVWAMQWLASAVHLPPLSFGESAVLVGVLAIGFALPNAPGFFGSVQLALYAGLALYVPAGAVVHEGAGLVFLFYIGYLGIVFGLALVGVVAESRAS